jgi:hypothetical protein
MIGLRILAQSAISKCAGSLRSLGNCQRSGVNDTINTQPLHLSGVAIRFACNPEN